MITREDILAAYHRRFACKKYDASKKICEQDFATILEAGRLSPSSFGWEPWQFLVIENAELKAKLAEIAWGAKDKLTGASHFIILLARQPADLQPNSDYISSILYDLYHFPQEIAEMRRGFYANYAAQDAKLTESDRAYWDWASKQTYIALGNMLTTAAMLDIDSTPIEGFDYAKVNELLAQEGVMDSQHFQVSVMAAFGYAAEPPRNATKLRRSHEEVIKWVK